MTPDILLILAVLVPLAGAGLVMANRGRPNWREACSFLSAATLFALTLCMVPHILGGKRLYLMVFDLVPGHGPTGGLSLALRADALSLSAEASSVRHFSAADDFSR